MDSSPNTRTGLIFFAFYFVLYTAFVFASAFAPTIFEHQVAGVTFAVLAGMALILGAIGLAVVYCWVCRAQPGDGPERRS